MSLARTAQRVRIKYGSSVTRLKNSQVFTALVLPVSDSPESVPSSSGINAAFADPHNVHVNPADFTSDPLKENETLLWQGVSYTIDSAPPPLLQGATAVTQKLTIHRTQADDTTATDAVTIS